MMMRERKPANDACSRAILPSDNGADASSALSRAFNQDPYDDVGNEFDDEEPPLVTTRVLGQLSADDSDVWLIDAPVEGYATYIIRRDDMAPANAIAADLAIYKPGAWPADSFLGKSTRRGANRPSIKDSQEDVLEGEFDGQVWRITVKGCALFLDLERMSASLSTITSFRGTRLMDFSLLLGS